MRNQKGLSSVEAWLILVIILNMSSVGCSRWEAGKSQGAAGEASQIEAKQTPRQKVLPEEPDETADWITYVGAVSRFSLRYPKYWAVGHANPQNCIEAERSDFTAGANADLVADCGTEYVGQIYIYSNEGNELSSHKLTTDLYPYQDITSKKVMVDNIEGTREAGTAMGQMDAEKFAMPGLPDGTKVVIYSFYAHGRTYVARYGQRIGDPDILRDFDLMITKTLKFSN
jgi:hypothetical protein